MDNLIKPLSINDILLTTEREYKIIKTSDGYKLPENKFLVYMVYLRKTFEDHPSYKRIYTEDKNETRYIGPIDIVSCFSLALVNFITHEASSGSSDFDATDIILLQEAVLRHHIRREPLTYDTSNLSKSFKKN